MRGSEYNRLMFVLSAFRSPVRRYATSVSRLNVDVIGKVTAAPTGDAPPEPMPTYGVTSTALASCAATGMAPNASAMKVKTANLYERMAPPQPRDCGRRTFRRRGDHCSRSSCVVPTATMGVSSLPVDVPAIASYGDRRGVDPLAGPR